MNPDDASPSWYNGVGPYSGPSSRARSSAQEPTVDADPPSVPELLSSISDNSPVKDVAVTSDNNAQQPDSNQPVSDSEECDSSCICGAGTLLGVFRGIPMYDNHKHIDCIASSMKLKIHYLLPEYFGMLKEMELFTDDSFSSYASKILNLYNIWKKFQLTMTNNPCSGMNVFLHFAFSESAALVLQPEWEQIKNSLKLEFIATMEVITHTSTIIRSVDEVNMCTCFVFILKSPWNHVYVSRVLHGQCPSYKQMEELIKFERSAIILHRLKFLCKTQEQQIKAIRFAFLATRYYEKHLVGDSNQTFFPEEDYECIRDIYYVLLIRFGLSQNLIEILKKFNPQTRGMKLMVRCYNKIKYLTSLPQEDRPILYELQLTFCEYASTIMVFNTLRCKRMYKMFCKLLHYWIEIIMVLRNSDLENAHSLTVRDEYMFTDLINDIIKYTISSNYLYSLIDIMNEKFGSKFSRTFYVRIYIHALIMNINETIDCKRSGNKEKSFNLLNSLVKGYLDLADLLDDILSVSRECVLSAYTLMPTSDLLARIEDYAIKSGKHIEEDPSSKKNECTPKKLKVSTEVHKSDREKELFKQGKDCHTVICSDLDKLQPNPLTSAMKHNLINALWQPRSGTLNWNMEWSQMKSVLNQYQHNLDMVINRSLIRYSDLNFINLDISEYNKFAEMTMNTLTNKTGDCTSDNSNEDGKKNTTSLGKTVPNLE